MGSSTLDIHWIGVSLSDGSAYSMGDDIHNCLIIDNINCIE